MKASTYSNKAIQFSSEEKAKIATLLRFLCDKLINEGHEDMEEGEINDIIGVSDHIQFRLLGKSSSDQLPKGNQQCTHKGGASGYRCCGPANPGTGLCPSHEAKEVKV